MMISMIDTLYGLKPKINIIGTQGLNAFGQPTYYNTLSISGTSNVAGNLNKQLIPTAVIASISNYYEKQGKKKAGILTDLSASMFNIINGARLKMEHDNAYTSGYYAKEGTTWVGEREFLDLDKTSLSLYDLLNSDLVSDELILGGAVTSALTINQREFKEQVNDVDKFYKVFNDSVSYEYQKGQESYWKIKGARVKPKKEIELRIKEDDINHLDVLIMRKLPRLEDFKLKIKYQDSLTLSKRREIKFMLKEFMKFYRYQARPEMDLTGRLEYNVKEI
jgi:hypothetical protein